MARLDQKTVDPAICNVPWFRGKQQFAGWLCSNLTSNDTLVAPL